MSEDKVLCPKCKRWTRNMASIRHGTIKSTVTKRDISVTGVGFRCEHCGHEWGHFD